ncbi:FAD-binding oxidoreductase [Ancylobacter oerskovii]|uniref:FAD-binding oxidoreductase n=1 Tax=Ancylobacter oerskovii TaxID=459519 RepID=A0ABW4YWT6_9HYPH|nr:FAD-binding oxidoreductase [Ancylobacter oerskovii]MBS7542217.1 FAD-binding oxidoreductase [Ancylobacter oerskovii]
MSDRARVTRRGVLAGGAAAATALGIGPLLGQEASSPIPAAPAIVPDRWDRLARIAGDDLLRPSSPQFAAEALPNNLRFEQVRPEAIVPCRSPRMIAEVLAWCQEHEMPFALRGGGHSYAGFSTSRGVVLDMTPMDAIAYDAASGRVRVAAGALNAQVYEALRGAGRMITHGRCPTVGAAGFLLGGGIGFNMRRFGVGADRLVASEIVTADGRVRALSQTDEPDLFWAIRGGGGGNFGVSTSFTLETQPVDTRLTVARLVWRDKTLEAAKALFACTDAGPRVLGSRIALGGVTPALAAKGRQVPLTLLAQYAGPREEFLALLAPVLAVAAPDFTDMRELAYWEGQHFLLEPGEPGWYRERSAFLANAPSEAFLETAVEHLRQWPGTGAQASLFFFQTGGQVNETPPEATAFVHRDSRWLGVVGAVWNAEDVARPEVVRAAKAWQDALYGVVNRFGGAGAFQNFPDASLTDWRARYYGANLARLERIKAAVDPTNLFSFPQSI